MTTRYYTTRIFFRQMPNALLQRYFTKHRLCLDVDFKAIKETKPEPLLKAWLALPEDTRQLLEAECQDIFMMSCEKGFRAILDEAAWQWRHASPEELGWMTTTLAEQPSHYHRAMLTFLEHPTCWQGALRFFHADTLPYWRKRKHLDSPVIRTEPQTLQQFAHGLGEYFHHYEGRGKHCLVEHQPRNDLDYFFAYPEDYSHQQIEWVDGRFGKRPHNPAFEIVFVYSRKQGTLDINYRGTKKVIERLQEIFAKTILGYYTLTATSEDNKVYDLNPLAKRDFEFVIPLGSGIEEVTVRKLRLTSRFNKGDQIVLEVDQRHNSHSVHETLEQIGQSISLTAYNITQVELAVRIIVNVDKPAKTIPVRLTCPDLCSLKYNGPDLVLRAMLSASGIEPKIKKPAVINNDIMHAPRHTTPPT